MRSVRRGDRPMYAAKLACPASVWTQSVLLGMLTTDVSRCTRFATSGESERPGGRAPGVPVESSAEWVRRASCAHWMTVVRNLVTGPGCQVGVGVGRR